MASKTSTSTLSEGNLSWSKADDSLMDAVYKRDVVKVKSLVSRKRANPTKISPHLGLAAIHQAASFDKPDILDALLMFPSIDVNKADARKRTALHHAVLEGRDECLKRLILMNANTMLVENEGLSAIHLASMLGHMGCVHLLVSTVQSVDARDDKGRTALFYAASRGSASSCRLLIEYGANINATDNYGRTVLMVTAENGHQAAFQYLLSRGANFSIRDKKGRDIRWYATNHNHADLLLLLPNGIDRRSFSNTSNEEDERLAASSQRRLAKKWGPEFDLSRADPERTAAGHQKQVHTSTTDSEQRSNSVLEDEVNVRSVAFVEQQTPNAVDDRREEQEWTNERLELIRKLTDLADENKELIQWKAKTESTEQQNINLLTSQRRIYPLMEEVYQSVESCRREAGSTEDGQSEASTSRLRDASQKLTLILQSMYEMNRRNGSSDEMGDPFAEEMSRRGKVIGGLEGSVKEYDKEMKRLEAEIRRLSEVTEAQQSRIREQEEQLGQLQLKIRDHTISLRRFSSAIEALSQVTGLDDVDEEYAADVIRQMAVEYEKLQAKYIALKAKQREVKTTSSELHPKESTTADEVLTERHSNNDDVDDLRNKTMQEIRAMRNLSATPISDLLQQQLIVLRKSLESQIVSVHRKANFDDKTGRWLLSPDASVALQKSDEFTNSTLETDEYISRGREIDGVKKETMSSKSRRDFSEPQMSRTSDCHSLDEDERIRYEAEIRQLRSKIDLMKLEDSGVRTFSTDADDESHTLQLLSQQTPSPVPDESVGILTENRRLKSELEKLRRSRIEPEKSVVVCRTEQEARRTDSKGMQTDVELLKEVMLSRMASNYEKELLDKVESLKNQNAQLRSEIDSLSAQKSNKQETNKSNAPMLRGEHVGSAGELRDARLPSSARYIERRENGQRRLQDESDSSSGESVDSGELSFSGSNPHALENAKKRKKRKEGDGEKPGIRDVNGRSSLSSFSQTSSSSSNEENRGRTLKQHDTEHMAKKTNNKIVAGASPKDIKAAGLSTDDETYANENDDERYANENDDETHANESHNASFKPPDVVLPGRTTVGDPGFLTAEFAQKLLVKKLMNLPDSNTPPLNSRGSSVTRVKATPDRRIADATNSESTAVTNSSFPNAPATESNHGKRISHDVEKAKTSSTRRRSNSSSYDDEAFESMFQVNQNLIGLSKPASSKSTNEAKRKTKIKLLRFDAQARTKLRMDLETIIQENTRLREEISGLKAEISSLKQTTPKANERVDLLPPQASAGVERVSKRHSAVSKEISTGQPVISKGISTSQQVTSGANSTGQQVTSKGISTVQQLSSSGNGTGQQLASKRISTGQPVTSTGNSTGQPVVSADVEINSLRRPAASEEETNNSQDEEGYRFLSEDENGTLKFKEFSQQTPSQMSREEEEEDAAFSSNTGSSDDDISHSPPRSTSGSTSLDSTDEAENNVRGRRHRDGRCRKRDEAKDGKLKRKVSNEIQQCRLNETVTLVVSNQAERSGDRHQPPQPHLHHQQQHSSRKAVQLREGKGDKLEASNSLKNQGEILMISGETLTDADKTQIYVLQKKLQDSEKLYKAIIGTYRSHLLASIQGCLDHEVADALCRIVTLQNGRLLEY